MVSQTSWGCWQLEGPSWCLCLIRVPLHLWVSEGHLGMWKKKTIRPAASQQFKIWIQPVSYVEWLYAGFCFCSSAWHVHLPIWWIFGILLWSNHRAVLWPQLAGNHTIFLLSPTGNVLFHLVHLWVLKWNVSSKDWATLISLNFFKTIQIGFLF